MQLSRKPFRHLWLIYMIVDVTAIVAAYYTVLFLRFDATIGERIFGTINRFFGIRETGAVGLELETFYMVSGPRIILFLSIILCLIYGLRDLYPGRRFIRRQATAWNVVLSNVIAMGLLYVYFYFRRNTYHPRSFFPTVLLLNVIYCADFRAILDRALDRLRHHWKIDVCPAIIVGTNRHADVIDALIDDTRPHGIHIVHRVALEPDQDFDAFVSRLRNDCRDHAEAMLIVAEPDLSVSQIMTLLELSDDLDIPCKVLSEELDILVARARVAVDMVHGLPLVHFEAPSVRHIYAAVKRWGAAAASVVVTLLLLPLMGLIALLVRATSKGPALFIQERIGVNRRPFRMFKFRTMYHRSDEEQAQLEEFNESGTGLFKIRKDPRVTPFGRLLRRFSLDELPQLLNVVRGDMTIVGPRPLPRRDFENYYEEWHYSRHNGMPGLTCLWQVSGRSDLDFHSMCILDVYYLRNQNWILDARIMLRTLWVVLFAKGAY